MEGTFQFYPNLKQNEGAPSKMGHRPGTFRGLLKIKLINKCILFKIIVHLQYIDHKLSEH